MFSGECNRIFKATSNNSRNQNFNNGNQNTNNKNNQNWVRGVSKIQKEITINHTPCNIDFEELARAYFDCRRNKRNTYSALEFEIDLETNLWELYNHLISGQYEIGSSYCFVVKKPRVREIWAAQFRDRVVHHLIYNRLSPKWNRSFTADSCACIPGRGTKYGAERLESHIRSLTNNWAEGGWYLKCDLANFFVSIDKNILWGLMESKIKEGWLKDLTKMVLYHDPRKMAIIKSTEEEMSLVPEHKRLLVTPSHKGLPIGNLVSQFFANILLDSLDKYVKHELKVPKYVRYVDDCILLSKDKEQLKSWMKEIECFVKTLNLEFNPRKCFIQPIERGVSFVGQTIFPYRRVPLANTAKSCFYKLGENTASNNSLISFLGQSQKSYNIRNRFLDKSEDIGQEVCRERLIVKTGSKTTGEGN